MRHLPTPQYKKAYKLLIASISVFMSSLVMPAYAADKTQTEISKSALTMAEQRRYDEALNILSTQSDQNSYSLRYTKAQVLTWAGNFSMANPIYESLLQEDPNDADVLVSFAYQKLFSGDSYTAEGFFRKVIESHPTYLDAYDGLKRFVEAQSNQKIVLAKY